jgi:hypothetical protein
MTLELSRKFKLCYFVRVSTTLLSTKSSSQKSHASIKESFVNNGHRNLLKSTSMLGYLYLNMVLQMSLIETALKMSIFSFGISKLLENAIGPIEIQHHPQLYLRRQTGTA